MDNIEDHDPKLPTTPRPNVTPFPTKVIPLCPLRTKLKDNYDDVRDMFEKIKLEIPLFDVIQYMPCYAKSLKDVCTQK